MKVFNIKRVEWESHVGFECVGKHRHPRIIPHKPNLLQLWLEICNVKDWTCNITFSLLILIASKWSPRRQRILQSCFQHLRMLAKIPLIRYNVDIGGSAYELKLQECLEIQNRWCSSRTLFRKSILWESSPYEWYGTTRLCFVHFQSFIGADLPQPFAF